MLKPFCKCHPYSAGNKPTMNYHVINFSITAHHLYKDWLKRELAEADYLKLKAQVEAALPIESGLIRVAAMGRNTFALIKPACSSHRLWCEARRIFESIQPAHLTLGAYSLYDTSKVYFDNVADKVLRFWKDYLDHTNKPLMIYSTLSTFIQVTNT